MKKAMVMAGVMTAAVFTHASVEAETSFSDMPEGFWAQEEVKYLAEHEVMNGYEGGAFGVNDEITRAQAARTLARIHELDTEDHEPVSFEDVRESDRAYPEIAAAVEAGYFADGEAFRPNESLTRSQMAAILTRAYELNGEKSVDYRDVSEGYWAYEDISLLGENRLTTGYEDLTFQPSSEVTRSQFAVFLARAEEESFRKDVAILPQRKSRDVYYPRISGLEEASQEHINQTLMKHAENSANEQDELYESEQEETREDWEGTYEYEEMYRVEQNNQEHLSIVFEEYQFRGGAHGISDDTAYTFDPESGEGLELKDLFADDTDYVSIIDEKVEAGVTDEGHQLEFIDDIDFDGIDPETDQFYVTEDGPAVYFQPYEIAPYAAGMPVFTTPWEAFDPEESGGERSKEQEFSFEQEGMEQTDIFKLMDEPGIPFTTYLPQYFEVENVSSGAADGALVYAKFTEDTEPTDEPVWRFIYPSYGKEEGVNLDDMIESVHEYAKLDEVNLDLVDEEKNPDFGEYNARFETDEGLTYWITILEHEGTYMEWHREYPHELAEGIGPREVVLKEEWQWKN